jgi:hypothetical protein
MSGANFARDPAPPALMRLFNLLNSYQVKFHFALQNNNLPGFALLFCGFGRMLRGSDDRPRAA